MTFNLYPKIIHERDLSPDAVGPEIEEACKEIHEACKGFGTNEGRIIKALATQNAEARVKISLKYKELYGKELKDVLKRECGGDLGQALQFLAVPLDQAECAMLQKAFKGTGTNEKVLYPILCGRSNEEITILKKTYFNEYTKDLGSVLNSEVGGDLEKILFNSLQGVQEAFDPEFHTAKKAENDVVDLYKAGQGNFLGTSEKKLFKILCASPPEYLEQVNLLYAEKYGYTLFKALEKELHGDSEDAAMFTLGMKLKPYATVAKLIKESCAGLGSNELLLTCTLIRYQAIMKNVQEAYIELFGESVEDRVKSETRGDYEKLLVAVVQAATEN